MKRKLAAAAIMWAKRILIASVILGITGEGLYMTATSSIRAQAITSAEAQNQIDAQQAQIAETQGQLDSINDRIGDLQDEQDLIEEELEDLNAEILNMMTSIGMKEDEIAEKQGQIGDKQQEIVDKQADIDDTETEYEAWVEKEAKQYDDMVLRIRAMYENGDASMISMIVQGNGLGDVLNRMDFVERVYEYDREKLTEYTDTKDMVLALFNQLQGEKEQLQGQKDELQQEETVLEGEKAKLQESKAQLDVMLADLKAKSSNYDALIKKATQEAAVAKAQLKAEQKELKNLQNEKAKALAAEEAERAAAAAAAAAAAGGTTGSATTATNVVTGGTAYSPTTSTTDYDSIIDAANGSSTGKAIAKYACQYIGNPYVRGGTSLTNGADCSGFTYRVYADFGYTIPRTSTEQRSAGTGVSYEDAQPGDLICYSGHVALYIGNGLIVHASTAKTGIKVSKATYKTILAVRRIL